MWRPEDEHLLQRLEDETLADALFRALVGVPAEGLHPRAGGLVAELRKLPGGAEAVGAALGGEIGRLDRFVRGLTLASLPPELLHHLALLHRRVALALEDGVPDASAEAWVRSIAAWLALGEERSYLSRLEEAVLGPAAVRSGHRPAIPPELVPLEQISEVAQRAQSSARDLALRGRAALQALARIDEAARLAGVPEATAKRARATAERLRNAAIEAALSVVGEAIDDASARGEPAAARRTLLLGAIPVWTWTSNDEAVEHFVVERIDVIGWELYRARGWDALRALLEPFTPMFERLAERIERDPSRIAYAAGCAQMFVFLSEMNRHAPTKLALAERAVRICPTHRNGRLILASVLCDQAIETMGGFGVFARKGEVERVEGLLARAESLYPQSKELPEAKKMLEQVKRSKIAI